MVESKSEDALTAIRLFLAELNTAFGSEYRKIALLHKIADKTTSQNSHQLIQTFRDFSTRYKTALVTTNKELLDAKCIVYRHEVKNSTLVLEVDLPSLLQKSDSCIATTIWDHLLVIAACLLPEDEEIKAKLRSHRTNNKEELCIGQLLANVETSVAQNAASGQQFDMMSTISQMMASPMVQELFTGMSSGNVDVSKIVNGLSSMVDNLKADIAQKAPAANNDNTDEKNSQQSKAH